jgi:hypothetical protein
VKGVTLLLRDALGDALVKALRSGRVKVFQNRQTPGS